MEYRDKEYSNHARLADQEKAFRRGGGHGGGRILFLFFSLVAVKTTLAVKRSKTEKIQKKDLRLARLERNVNPLSNNACVRDCR